MSRLLFKIFLIAYGTLLTSHMLEMQFGSWQVVVVMFTGLVAALFAHKGHGQLPSWFLVAHMMIEWQYHAAHGNNYAGNEIAFHLVHVFMDMGFLFVEAKAHYKKQAPFFILFVLALLISVFIYSYAGGPSTHEHTDSLLSYLIMGGLLGYVMSHLFSLKKG